MKQTSTNYPTSSLLLLLLEKLASMTLLPHQNGFDDKSAQSDKHAIAAR
jgi:hypothetical protein